MAICPKCNEECAELLVFGDGSMQCIDCYRADGGNLGEEFDRRAGEIIAGVVEIKPKGFYAAFKKCLGY